LFVLTKRFPNWDLIRILDYCCRGKKLDEPNARSLRSRETKSENEEKEIGASNEEEYLSQDEVERTVGEMSDKIREIFGFNEVNKDKVMKILDKNGMDVKRTVSLVKKNLNFYKKYFQASSEK